MCASLWAPIIVRDGLLTEVTDGRAPNTRAFPKTKSAEKGALIVNMTTVDDRCTKVLHRLQLPTMESLAAYLRKAVKTRQHIFFCKLDVCNMFWSCHTPEHEANSIRSGVRDTVCGFHGLPFLMDLQPDHGYGIALQDVGETEAHQCGGGQVLDDILIASTNPLVTVTG